MVREGKGEFQAPVATAAMRHPWRSSPSLPGVPAQVLEEAPGPGWGSNLLRELWPRCCALADQAGYPGKTLRMDPSGARSVTAPAQRGGRWWEEPRLPLCPNEGASEGWAGQASKRLPGGPVPKPEPGTPCSFHLWLPGAGTKGGVTVCAGPGQAGGWIYRFQGHGGWGDRGPPSLG